VKSLMQKACKSDQHLPLTLTTTNTNSIWFSAKFIIIYAYHPWYLPSSMRANGTPRSVSISVGAIPTHQINCSGGSERNSSSVGVCKLWGLCISSRVASKQTVMRKREHASFVNQYVTDESVVRRWNLES